MDNYKNKFTLILFIIVVFVFIIGGFIFMKYMINMNNNEPNDDSNNDSITEVIDIRIDKDKDYIYFEETDHLLEDFQIIYADVYFNFTGYDDIQDNINAELAELEKTLKYEVDVEIPEDVELEKNSLGIYSASYKIFDVIVYENYLTLVEKDISYDIVNILTPLDIKNYVFDKNTGMMIEESSILANFNITIDEIKVKVQDKLNTLNYGVEPVIEVENTINNFNYVLYVNKLGKLEIEYIVQSTTGDYYDTLVIN